MRGFGLSFLRPQPLLRRLLSHLHHLPQEAALLLAAFDLLFSNVLSCTTSWCQLVILFSVCPGRRGAALRLQRQW